MNEVAITQKLGCYFQEYFIDYNVDTEYNRNYDSPKQIVQNGRRRNIKPDIIVHHRGSNDFNFLVIEAKKSNNRDSGSDISKLKKIDWAKVNNNKMTAGMGKADVIKAYKEDWLKQYVVVTGYNPINADTSDYITTDYTVPVKNCGDTPQVCLYFNRLVELLYPANGAEVHLDETQNKLPFNFILNIFF
jgi:hypothetical protein